MNYGRSSWRPFINLCNVKVNFELLRTALCLHHWMSYLREGRICPLHLHLLWWGQLECQSRYLRVYRAIYAAHTDTWLIQVTGSQSAVSEAHSDDPQNTGIRTRTRSSQLLLYVTSDLTVNKFCKSIFVFCTDFRIKNNYLPTGDGITTIKNRA